MLISERVLRQGGGRAGLSAAVVIFVASSAYLFLMLVRQPLESMDFRYIWLAGELWSHGANPYSSAYRDAGAIQFPTGYAIAVWAYPFHWYIPARLAAALSPQLSFACWLGATTMALAGSAWLALGAARALGFVYRLETVLFALGYACSGSIVGYALRTGQPAVLAECGVAIAIFGMARNQRWCVISGLVLAMLKPQIGLPFATAVCFEPKGLRDALASAVLVLVASVPAFLASGFVNQMHGLLIESSGAYQTISYNTADLMAGLPHLVGLTTRWSFSILGSMFLAAALTALASWVIRRQVAEHATALRIGFTCTITAAVVGLHTYDLIIVLFTLPLMKALSRGARAVAFLGFALLWRTENLVHMLGFSVSWLPTVQSVALLLLLGAWLSTLVTGPGDVARDWPSESLTFPPFSAADS